MRGHTGEGAWGKEVAEAETEEKLSSHPLSSLLFSSSVVIPSLTLLGPKAPQWKKCLDLLNLWEDKA